MPPPDLTLLVPCYQEGARVERLVVAWSSWQARHPDIRSELVCVDDGSLDDTRERLRAHPEARLVELPFNQGKGAALRAGVAAARGRTVLWFDADLAVDLGHVDRALAALGAGADLAIGSRSLPDAATIEPQGPWRRGLGRVYRALAVRWLDLRVSDVTCGFKAMRRDRVAPLFAETRAMRWGIDAELLHLARRAGLTVAEFPVTWSDGTSSRVRLGRDVLGSLRELFAARRRGPSAARTS